MMCSIMLKKLWAITFNDPVVIMFVFFNRILMRKHKLL